MTSQRMSATVRQVLFSFASCECRTVTWTLKMDPSKIHVLPVFFMWFSESMAKLQETK